MRKAIRWACASTVVVVLMAAIGAWALFRAAQTPPSFYQAVLQQPPAEQAVVGDEFEREVLELRNEARNVGDWQAVFSMEQVNGWLAVDLPEKFPEAIPAGVADPRVVIEDRLIRVAAHYEDARVRTVVSFALDVSLTEEPNTLAVRICDVRAGLLPVPVSTWMEQLQSRLEATDWEVRWSQVDGDPVALVRIPPEASGKAGKAVSLEEVTIESGKVTLAGRTMSAAEFERTQNAVVRNPSADEERRQDMTQR